ncbi:basic helix-loop-helix (bHLH) DNA-binding superfamily protein [Rhynchospora pubera]|uniref:Basic helix-loop-helix (BHLH) DNA-binding superfamily protein n=1 Tax=Rhynchospora pubera TaxID=906938 RepID=A0AAV8CF43_9POAL|nr:basic helix-loop-helix (bHLH) DNA-binding superfamily protein [Rhynchospora pubera]
MWNPTNFNSAPPSYINSGYNSLNSFTGEGGESSSNLPISNDYDKLFLSDWFPSAYSTDRQVSSQMDFSSSSLALPPFPLPSNVKSYSVEEENISMQTMGLKNGGIQFKDSQAVSVIELNKLVETEEEIGRGTSSRDTKRFKSGCAQKLLKEASTSARKQPPKGAGKKPQKLGPKITALQRLISPYGRTDAASVLSETANHIMYLQEQIKILTSPYMVNTHPQQAFANMSCELRSRGLCLIPLSQELVDLASRVTPAHNAPKNTVLFPQFRR